MAPVHGQSLVSLSLRAGRRSSLKVPCLSVSTLLLRLPLVHRALLSSGLPRHARAV